MAFHGRFMAFHGHFMAFHGHFIAFHGRFIAFHGRFIAFHGYFIAFRGYFIAFHSVSWPLHSVSVTAKICSHRRVRVEISTRTRWFFLCWKFVIFSWKIHVWGITLPNPTPLRTSPIPLGATANIADRMSPSPSAECPKNHTEFPKTLLSDCPLTRACWKCNAYALGAWRVRVGVSTRTC